MLTRMILLVVVGTVSLEAQATDSEAHLTRWLDRIAQAQLEKRAIVHRGSFEPRSPRSTPEHCVTVAGRTTANPAIRSAYLPTTNTSYKSMIREDTLLRYCHSTVGLCLTIATLRSHGMRVSRQPLVVRSE